MSEKILFLSKDGSGADLAFRLQEEGSDVRLFTYDKEAKENFVEIVEKVDSWEPHIKWADFIVLDDVGLPEQRQAIIRAGKPAFGMGHSKRHFDMGDHKFNGFDVGEVLEFQRSFSHDLMEELGIGQVIESLEFSNIAEAVRHLREHNVPHVIKPECRDGGSEKTYVSEMEDGSDAIKWLETLPKRPGGAKIHKIELQEKILGIEVGVSAWFNGNRFIGPVNINFEHKKLATGDLGFNTGEMGTVMYCDQRDPKEIKLFSETLAKMEPFLAGMDYRGQIDLNMIANKEGLWPLEFTPRLGYPAIYIEQESQITPWTELLGGIARGEEVDNTASDEWCIGVVLAGEGFPFWKEGRQRMAGIPIMGVNKNNIEHIHLCDAMVSDDLVATGCYTAIASAAAPTLKQAQERVYKEVIPQIFFPSMYYRTDIGDRVFEDLKKLEGMGYALNPV